jgi:iron complex outermembrane receptor protein
VQDYLLEDVDRIEVVSGPGGTLWGANAVNGVINITTKSAKDTQGLFLEAGGGTGLRQLAALRYGGTLAPGVHFRIYGKYLDHDSSVFANGQAAANGWRMGRGGWRIDAGTGQPDVFTVQGDYYRGREEVAGAGTSHVSGGNVLGRWTRTLSPESNFSLQLYYDRTHLAAPKPGSARLAAGVLTDDLDTYDLDFQHQLRLGRSHQMVWGFGYRFTRDSVGNAPTVAFVPARLDQSLYSVFVQDEVAVGDNTSLTVGSKLEHSHYTGLEVEPSVRLQRNLGSRQMIWAAISRAVRTPSRVDRDLRQPTGLPLPFAQSVLTGGPDFRSETLVAYEAGYRAQLGTRASASLAFFYNDYAHVRSITPAPLAPPNFGFPLVFHNNIEGETHGFELSGVVAVTERWRLKGGFNLLREHLRVKPGEVDFTNALNETADPLHQFSLHSALDLPRDFQLDAGLRWVDERHNNNGATRGIVPSYTELDVRLAWRASEHLEFSLIGRNLLHPHHPEYGFAGPAREEVERSVYAKATWRY